MGMRTVLGITYGFANLLPEKLLYLLEAMKEKL
jgi:hypothetical protein